MTFDFQIPWPKYPFHRHSDKRVTKEHVNRFRDSVRQLASRAGISSTTDEEVAITCRFFPPANQDLDNIVKPLLDALKGTIYRDDSQVVELHSFLWRGSNQNPRMELTIETLDGLGYFRFLLRAGGTGNELKELSQLIIKELKAPK
jgi:Holliday junction resolvase RusA-like endonuclease